MKHNKEAKSFVLIYAIVAVIFTLLTLIIPFEKPAASWVMFAFSLFSVAGGCAISLYAFGKSNELKSKFYGYPVFRIGFIYTAVQLALSILMYFVGAFVNLPYWVGVLISVLPAGMAAIGVIAADSATQYVQEIENKTVIATGTIRKFNVDIAGVLDICKNEDARAPLKKLVERFKYSDPVSSEATEEQEQEIKIEIENLKKIINTESTEVVIDKIQNISNLLSSRNRICEMEKSSQ